jgi:hypothetical protein
MDHIIRKAIQIIIHPNNTNTEDGLPKKIMQTSYLPPLENGGTTCHGISIDLILEA